MNRQVPVLGWLLGTMVGVTLSLELLPYLAPLIQRSPSIARPETAPPPSEKPAHPFPSKVLHASFEVVETLSTHEEINGAKKAFAFPPLRFQWQGRPEDLAPAFIWQSPTMGYHIGANRVPEGPDGDAILSHYSPTLAIRMTGTVALLRMHENVIARLRTWVEDLGSDLKDPAPLIEVEPRGPNEVVLRMPAVGHHPALTLVVGV